MPRLDSIGYPRPPNRKLCRYVARDHCRCRDACIKYANMRTLSCQLSESSPEWRFSTNGFQLSLTATPGGLYGKPTYRRFTKTSGPGRRGRDAPRTLAPSPTSLQVAPRLYAGHWTFANVQTAIAAVRKPGNLHNPSTPNPGGKYAPHPPHRNTIPPMQRPSRLPRHRPSVSMRAGQPEARSGRSISEHGSCNVRKVSLLRATADTIFGEFDPLCREEKRHCARGRSPLSQTRRKYPFGAGCGEILASSNS